ncbi:unnamed protein product [Musa textilis]
MPPRVRWRTPVLPACITGKTAQDWRYGQSALPCFTTSDTLPSAQPALLLLLPLPGLIGMATVRPPFSAALLLPVLILVPVWLGATPSSGSLLPWLDGAGSPLADRFPDPFRILEHVTFGLDRDDMEVVTHARVDWKETPTHHHIMIDVPGLRKEELKIEVEENRILRVSGERRREEEKKDEHWHRVERSYGKFWRQFRLPDNADLDSVSAKLEDGVLTVALPKLAPEKIRGPRVVSIAGGDDAGDKEKLRGSSSEAKKVDL